MFFAGVGDFRLATLAGALAASVVYCAFTLAGRKSASQGRERSLRLAASAVALLMGLWGASVVGTASLLAEVPLRLSAMRWLNPPGISGTALMVCAITAAMASILGAAAGTAYADRRTRQHTQASDRNAERAASVVAVEAVEIASALPEAPRILKAENDHRGSDIEAPVDQPASSLMALGTGIALAAKTVLLLDRDRSSLDAIHSILTSLQMTIFTAMSAGEAVAQLEAGASDLKLDLILLDSRIPGGAPEFVEQLRRIRRGLPPMVMMLDGTERPSQRERLLRCGIAAFIAKPVWRADLEQVIFRVLTATMSEAQDTQLAAEEEVANRDVRLRL